MLDFLLFPYPGPPRLLQRFPVSGMDGSSFTYLGFAPRKDDERRHFFSEIRIAERTCVFFETGKRLAATLLLASEVLGDTRIMVVRELTKIHEEKLHGTAREVLDILEQRDSIRGEITVVVEPGDTTAEEVDVESVVKTLMHEGFSGKRLANEAGKRFGVRKSEAYGKFLEIKEDS
jgi:16S rRNA (cytidine1402-2'-O)-methyltransferase